MSIFENMSAKEIAICLSAFYEEDGKVTKAFLCLPDRVKYITMDQKAFDEGIKILREDYEVFWTPDTKPDDLKWKINKRRMKELQDRIAANSWYGASTGVAFGPGCVVTGNDYLYRRELGLPDNATVADICEKIRELKDEKDFLIKHADAKQEELVAAMGSIRKIGTTLGLDMGHGQNGVDDILKKIKGLKQDNNCLVTDLGQIHGHYRAMLDALDCKTVKDNVGALNKVRELMAFKRDASRLVGMGPSDGALAIFEHLADHIHSLDDVARERDEADRLRRHWHAKYEDEHKECVGLWELHAADKEEKNKQDTVIYNLRDNNTTLEYSVAALKKRIRSMEAEAAEKETKNKIIIDTLRDNLVDSIEECKKLNGRIRLLEDQLKLNGVPPLEDPLDPGF